MHSRSVQFNIVTGRRPRRLPSVHSRSLHTFTNYSTATLIRIAVTSRYLLGHQYRTDAHGSVGDGADQSVTAATLAYGTI